MTSALRFSRGGIGESSSSGEAVVGEDRAKTESAVQPLHIACFTMPQTLEEYLTSKYGADLSAVTAISGVPSDVTGKFLFPRTLKSLYLPTIFELQTAETTNANLLTPLPPLPTAPPRVA